jgi:hypothetical protein
MSCALISGVSCKTPNTVESGLRDDTVSGAQPVTDFEQVSQKQYGTQATCAQVASVWPDALVVSGQTCTLSILPIRGGALRMHIYTPEGIQRGQWDLTGNRLTSVDYNTYQTINSGVTVSYGSNGIVLAKDNQTLGVPVANFFSNTVRTVSRPSCYDIFEGPLAGMMWDNAEELRAGANNSTCQLDCQFGGGQFTCNVKKAMNQESHDATRRQLPPGSFSGTYVQTPSRTTVDNNREIYFWGYKATVGDITGHIVGDFNQVSFSANLPEEEGGQTVFGGNNANITLAETLGYTQVARIMGKQFVRTSNPGTTCEAFERLALVRAHNGSAGSLSNESGCSLSLNVNDDNTYDLVLMKGTDTVTLGSGTIDNEVGEEKRIELRPNGGNPQHMFISTVYPAPVGNTQLQALILPAGASVHTVANQPTVPGTRMTELTFADAVLAQTEAAAAQDKKVIYLTDNDLACSKLFDVLGISSQYDAPDGQCRMTMQFYDSNMLRSQIGIYDSQDTVIHAFKAGHSPYVGLVRGNDIERSERRAKQSLSIVNAWNPETNEWDIRSDGLKEAKIVRRDWNYNEFDLGLVNANDYIVIRKKVL